jgi:hypothetical protein
MNCNPLSCGHLATPSSFLGSYYISTFRLNPHRAPQSIYAAANMQPQASCQYKPGQIPYFFDLTDQFIITANIPGVVHFINISVVDPTDALSFATALVPKTIDVGLLCAAAAIGTILCVGNMDGTIRFWDARTE